MQVHYPADLGQARGAETLAEVLFPIKAVRAKPTTSASGMQERFLCKSVILRSASFPLCCCCIQLFLNT